jgi:hypothetical protein
MMRRGGRVSLIILLNCNMLAGGFCLWMFAFFFFSSQNLFSSAQGGLEHFRRWLKLGSYTRISKLICIT